MPIYEYNCPKCGSFDVIQGVNDKPLKANPECIDKKCPCKAERVMSASAFHLKGGGWYKDGYGGTKPSASSDKGSSDKSDVKPAAGGESKESSSKKESTSKTVSDKPKGGCGGGCKCH